MIIPEAIANLKVFAVNIRVLLFYRKGAKSAKILPGFPISQFLIQMNKERAGILIDILVPFKLSSTSGCVTPFT